jgi:DNA replication protein DnaC
MCSVFADDSARLGRTLEWRIRAAWFPAVQTFETFDFVAIAGLNRVLVLDLARCE